MLHLNCTAVSQSESSNFIMYSIRSVTSRRSSCLVSVFSACVNVRVTLIEILNTPPDDDDDDDDDGDDGRRGREG